MGKYTRYVLGGMGWLFLIVGIIGMYLAISQLPGDYGITQASAAIDTAQATSRMLALFILVSGLILIFCTRVLTLMEAREDS